MLTNIRIKNFKRLQDAEFELGKNVVLIGPNNSGKTTALQALTLWNIGLKKWNEKRLGKSSDGKRTGVAINRNDLFAIPVPSASLLWKDLHVRSGDGKKTQNIRIEITVDGVTNGMTWSCGFEFDYANEESFYCRPLRVPSEEQKNASDVKRMPVPEGANEINVSFLPPMSGLADREFFKQFGEISVLIGQGQTAQVLRNLCFQVCYLKSDKNGKSLEVSPSWEKLTTQIKQLFGVTLNPPTYFSERAEITLSYSDENGIELDISSSGRGLQQTLLLLLHLYANPKTVLLLVEPDAHLEILRQRQIYKVITDVAEEHGSQIIAASHSEVVLNEAAGRDMVIAFVGKPHRIDKTQQVLKALKDIGYENYYAAEQTGWVIYLEGSTDLEILRTFAKILDHPAAKYLERPFVHYLNNNLPQPARDHFFGLREAKPDLVGILIIDRIDKQLTSSDGLLETMWTRREIENYFCTQEVLLRYASGEQSDLFSESRKKMMCDAIEEVSSALKVLGKDPWSYDLKATDEFLDPLFENYFKRLNSPNLLRKSAYHALAKHLSREMIDSEVIEKLDRIVKTAARATPRQS